MDIDSITCSICDNGVESSSHLFFKCNMVRDIIRKITRWWDITYIEADSYEDWLNWLVNLRLSSNYKQALEGGTLQWWKCVGWQEIGRLVILVLLLAENLLNIFLIHFQNSSFSDSGEGIKAIIYGSMDVLEEDLNSFCSKLLPILEILEVLRE
ncbi:hypothetical protein Tco_1476975, partial [Tanacetum coccineum]